MNIRKFNESSDNREMFIKSLSTLFNSWGSDVPSEVFWGANELLDWYEVEFGVKLNIRFDEEDPNCDDVFDAIRQS